MFLNNVEIGDIMSNLVLILFLILIVYGFNYFVFEKFKSRKHNYLFLFLIFISIFSFFTVSARSVTQNDQVTIDDDLKLLENHFVDDKGTKLLNKVVVVGDSRMSLIVDNEDLVKPFNFMFVAKSGMKIDWLKDYALGQVKEILKNKNYNYHVVVNMGVNDLNDVEYKGDDISEKYFKLYKDLAKKYPNVKIYLMSVNPIDDVLINQKPYNNRTTEEILLFNKTTQDLLKRKGLDNMYYCDSYNQVNFKTDDGLHYTDDTNKEIIKYIDNECVQY